MKSTTNRKEIRVQTVERSLKLLEVLAEQGTPLTLTRIGQLTHLNLSSAYRILNTLCQSGFVEREKATGHYQLGLKAFLIGNAVLQRMNIRDIAIPYLSRFVENSNESIYLAILSRHHVIYTDVIRSTGLIQIGIQTGLQFPAYQTGAGKVLLANLPRHEQPLIINQYLQEGVITNSQDIQSDLDSIRIKGFHDGIICLNESIREISVPVYSYLGKCVGAISIFLQVGYSVPGDQERLLLEKLKLTASDISLAMGHREAVSN
jgi:DNA-binding IclR family transcriptional regulator